MQTLFHLRAHLPLVIGPKQPTLVVAECRLGCRANERCPTERSRSAAVDARHGVKPIRDREITAAGVILERIDESSDSYIPDRVRGQRVRQMAKRHGGYVRMLSQRCLERRHPRWDLRID